MLWLRCEALGWPIHAATVWTDSHFTVWFTVILWWFYMVILTKICGDFFSLICIMFASIPHFLRFTDMYDIWYTQWNKYKGKLLSSGIKLESSWNEMRGMYQPCLLTSREGRGHPWPSMECPGGSDDHWCPWLQWLPNRGHGFVFQGKHISHLTHLTLHPVQGWNGMVRSSSIRWDYGDSVFHGRQNHVISCYKML